MSFPHRSQGRRELRRRSLANRGGGGPGIRYATTCLAGMIATSFGPTGLAATPAAQAQGRTRST